MQIERCMPNTPFQPFQRICQQAYSSRYMLRMPALTQRPAQSPCTCPCTYYPSAAPRCAQRYLAPWVQYYCSCIARQLAPTNHAPWHMVCRVSSNSHALECGNGSAIAAAAASDPLFRKSRIRPPTVWTQKSSISRSRIPECACTIFEDEISHTLGHCG